MTNRNQWIIRIITIVYCLYMIFYANNYQFMALNVFLAYIPIEISFHFNRLNNQFLIAASLLWLLFYPNSPYLFTDYFHLEILSIYNGMNQIFVLSVSNWLSFAVLSFGILTYGILGMASAFTLLEELQQRSLFRKSYQRICYFLTLNTLASLAIYVGRFDRLHSIDLFIHPVSTISSIFFQWPIKKVMFIIIFIIFQLGFMWVVQILQTQRNERLY